VPPLPLTGNVSYSAIELNGKKSTQTPDMNASLPIQMKLVHHLSRDKICVLELNESVGRRQVLLPSAPPLVNPTQGDAHEFTSSIDYGV